MIYSRKLSRTRHASEGWPKRAGSLRQRRARLFCVARRAAAGNSALFALVRRPRRRTSPVVCACCAFGDSRVESARAKLATHTHTFGRRTVAGERNVNRRRHLSRLAWSGLAWMRERANLMERTTLTPFDRPNYHHPSLTLYKLATHRALAIIIDIHPSNNTNNTN